MVKVLLYTGVTWAMPPKFKEELDIYLSDMMESEMDLVLVVSGGEGVGKSFGVRGMGRYCATVLRKKYPLTKFDVDDIEFDLDVYLNKSLHHPRPDDCGAMKINCLDESRKALGRANGQTKVVKNFLDYLSECRAKRQVHIICLPAYHDLAPYVVNWRMPILTRFKKNYKVDETTHSGLRMKRGEFLMYTDPKQIQKYYDKKYQYPKKWDERDWWSPVEVFTPEEVVAYNAKKDAATIAKYDIKEDSPKKNKVTFYRRKVVSKLKPYLESLGVKATQDLLGELLLVDRSSISTDLSYLEEKMEGENC